MLIASSFCVCLLATGIILSACVSLPIFYRRRHFVRGDNGLYYDKDGTTTPDNQTAFTRRARFYIRAMLAVSVVGLITNLTAAILIREELEDTSDGFKMLVIFLKSCAAIFLAFQGVVMALTPSSTDRYEQGIITGVCSLLIYGANLWLDSPKISSSKLHLGFFTIHLFVLLTSTGISLTIPRRPEVFHLGRSSKVIDSQSTVSFLSRYTLSWATPILSHAMRKGRLDFDDLPFLDARTSVKSLVAQFNSFTASRLWKHIGYAHRGTFARQWILTIFYSFATLAPQYFMWQLIRILENNPTHSGSTAGPWLALFGLAQLVQPWIETWMLWVGWCHIALPIYVQLSGLVAEKSMHKKDVKDVKAEDGESMNGETSSHKTRQDQINLVGVDAHRISVFLSYNGMVVGTILNLMTSFLFLLSLVSLKSILVGIIGVSFVVPINIFANRRYSTAQNSLMNVRDLKTAALTEALQGVRQIKFDALESQWQRKIRAVRDAELSQQWKAYIAESLLMLCWIAAPTIFAAIVLSTVSITEGTLKPSVAFTALAIFQRLEGTLTLVPELVTDFFNAWVSFDRVEEFLNSVDHLDATIDADIVALEGALVAWPSDEEKPGRFLLQNLNLSFPRHELSIIAGHTGAGKSLLLAAIIGEADVLLGTIRRPKEGLVDLQHIFESSNTEWILPKATAFVAQTPWIENATLRDNVLFGLPFSESRYSKVLRACALKQDIAEMENGDLTEIGSQGINLSGGQCSRLSLARALYSRAETLVLDDVFSAVDAHVARHLLDHALTGELAKGRTRILATHHIQLSLTKAKYTVLLKNGTLQYAGPPESLSQPLISLEETNEGSDASDIVSRKSTNSASTSTTSETISTEGNHSQSDRVQESFLYDAVPEIDVVATQLHKASETSEAIDEEEQKKSGMTNLHVYTEYLRAASKWPWTYWSTVVLIFVGFEVLLVGRNFWIKEWSEMSESISSGRATGTAFLSQEVMSSYTLDSLKMDRIPSNTFYILVYFALSLLISIIGASKFFWVYYGSIRASRVLFDNMTSAVLHAPLHWLDNVPTGRILNRFIADFSVIDSSLANDVVLLLYNALQLIGIIVTGSIVSPYLILCAIPLLLVAVAYARQYLAGARDVKRLESIKKTPIFTLLSSILTGLPTIRASNSLSTYTSLLHSHIDAHARCVWHLWLFNRWLGIRFAAIGAVFNLAVASFAIYSPSVSASLAGLALSFSLEFTQCVFWVLRRYANIEMDMNSLERISEFTSIPAETDEGVHPPAHWPSEGSIEISDLVVGYGPESPPVLRGITFRVEPSSRVGIVGRTGAGKSSLTLAIFRFLEARSGSVHIDGLDIARLQLGDLRRRIAIIPQRPVLWQGTVRSNLDPDGAFADEDLSDVLERVRLNHPRRPRGRGSSPPPDSTSSQEEDPPNTPPLFTLSTPVSEGGTNLSLGQRQLLCLGRRILSRPKILIMDEATSAVDMATDSLVQQSIRAELKGCTLVVIAHKLSTVADMDVVVVMEEGRVVEMGNPRELWERGGVWRGMVGEGGELGGLSEGRSGV